MMSRAIGRNGLRTIAARQSVCVWTTCDRRSHRHLAVRITVSMRQSAFRLSLCRPTVLSSTLGLMISVVGRGAAQGFFDPLR